MSAIPENAPQHCPGTQSQDAGKVSACAGCPNQNICASGVTSQPDPAIETIRKRLSNVKYKIVILSGKGGVGKSTVTALIAQSLSKMYPQSNIGVLDADICGPSQPRVLGVHGEQVHNSGSGWSPVYVTDNLSLMSIGFLLSSPDDAIIWRGPKKNGMIKQMLSEVDWGDLEYLLIDTPPGTSDEHLSTLSYLGSALTGAVVVSTPQEVALLDVRKELDFCNKVNLPVLGVVENMTAFICPNCHVASEIFTDSLGGCERLCRERGLQLLARLPLEPRLARALDRGADFLADSPSAPVATAAEALTAKLVAACEQAANRNET